MLCEDEAIGAHFSQRAGPEPLGPDSLVWRLGFPRAGLLVAGRALLLQTAHPVVGAGVRDFSDFSSDPWGRLERTLRSLQLQLFGGAAALEEAGRLRRLHAGFRGAGFDGAPYSALDPDAYAWVHLANFDTTLAFHRWFGPALRPEEQARLYAEWRQVGRLLGIADEHLPSDLDGCRRHVRTVVDGTLTDNDTVRTLLDSLRLSGVGPPWQQMPEPVWRALRPLGASFTATPPSARCPRRCVAGLACAGRRRTGRGSRPRRSSCAPRRSRCPTGSPTTRWAPAPGARPGRPAADRLRRDPPDGAGGLIIRRGRG